MHRKFLLLGAISGILLSSLTMVSCSEEDESKFFTKEEKKIIWGGEYKPEEFFNESYSLISEINQTNELQTEIKKIIENISIYLKNLLFINSNDNKNESLINFVNERNKIQFLISSTLNSIEEKYALLKQLIDTNTEKEQPKSEYESFKIEKLNELKSKLSQYVVETNFNETILNNWLDIIKKINNEKTQKYNLSRKFKINLKSFKNFYKNFEWTFGSSISKFEKDIFQNRSDQFWFSDILLTTLNDKVVNRIFSETTNSKTKEEFVKLAGKFINFWKFNYEEDKFISDPNLLRLIKNANIWSINYWDSLSISNELSKKVEVDLINNKKYFFDQLIFNDCDYNKNEAIQIIKKVLQLMPSEKEFEVDSSGKDDWNIFADQIVDRSHIWVKEWATTEFWNYYNNIYLNDISRKWEESNFWSLNTLNTNGFKNPQNRKSKFYNNVMNKRLDDLNQNITTLSIALDWFNPDEDILIWYDPEDGIDNWVTNSNINPFNNLYVKNNKGNKVFIKTPKNIYSTFMNKFLRICQFILRFYRMSPWSILNLEDLSHYEELIDLAKIPKELLEKSSEDMKEIWAEIQSKPDFTKEDMEWFKISYYLSTYGENVEYLKEPGLEGFKIKIRQGDYSHLGNLYNISYSFTEDEINNIKQRYFTADEMMNSNNNNSKFYELIEQLQHIKNVIETSRNNKNSNHKFFKHLKNYAAKNINFNEWLKLKENQNNYFGNDVKSKTNYQIDRTIEFLNELIAILKSN
ncbi:hypothetical protein VBM90_01175 [Mycoplasma sp. 2704]|uniref:hypothetical protein n=1 Tax=unclassified Mycoplasma TaxID=2683645 RepID=UPI002B1CE692|nr:hypothetical protein [Mycoplasma sp. 2704]MEA4134415.1 hypothetical protein [Mycoplasma sp. 2704]